MPVRSLTCNFVSILPCLNLTLRSRNATFLLWELLPNFKLEQRLWRSSKNNFIFSWPFVQGKKMSTMYQIHKDGFNPFCFWKLHFHLIHENTRIHQSTFSSNSCYRDLPFDLVIKFKEIIFQEKLCYLDEILCKEIFLFSLV